MAEWIQSDFVQADLVQGNVGGQWQVAYPSESIPTLSFIPSAEPLPGSRPGRLGGVLQQRSTSGRKRMWVVHLELRRWRFVFDWMTDADVLAREIFFSATRNKSFRVQPIFQAGYYTACWTGASLNFDPESRGAGYYRWEEELEEQPEADMPSSAELIRAGFITLSGADVEGEVIFDTPFDDDNYVVTLTIKRGGSVDVNGADSADDADWTRFGFNVLLHATVGPTPIEVHYVAVKRQ